MNATPPVSHTPIASDPAQQSAPGSVNSAASGGKAQDFAAALSNAGAKPARKTVGPRQAATGSVGGQLPAPGNLSPPPTSPVAAAGAAASAASPADGTGGGTAMPGNAAISGAPVKASTDAPVKVAQTSGSALLDSPAAASVNTAAASPGTGFALASAPGAATAVGLATAAGPAGAIRDSAAQAAAATEGLAAAKGAAAPSTGNKLIASAGTAAAASAATKLATSGPSTTDGNAAPSTNTGAWTSTDAAAQAPTAAAIAAAASGNVASGNFAGAKDSPSLPANDLATPAAGVPGVGGPNGAQVPALPVPVPQPAVAAAAANAQTVALAGASASDKRSSSWKEGSLLSGTVDSAAGAAQLGVNSARPTDAAPPTLKVSAGVDTPEFGQGLADRVSFMIDNNLKGAKLQVNPPQLGPIEVRIALQGNHAQVWLTSHSALTRDALESSAPKLREMLGAQGFGQVSVDISQRSFQERPAHPQPYDWTPSANRSPEPAAPQSTAGAVARTSSGAVDAYA